MTPQDRAEKCAALMWGKDGASQSLGMQIAAIGPGTATLKMQVRDDMLNGHGICHGGMILTLADSAFAFACNSHNRLSVAQHIQITYLAPANLGETLTARATEQAFHNRNGTYDIAVTGAEGRQIALVRGHSHSLNGQHFNEEQA